MNAPVIDDLIRMTATIVLVLVTAVSVIGILLWVDSYEKKGDNDDQSP
jgi:hypothetical protein